jgi:hypothetical protein
MVMTIHTNELDNKPPRKPEVKKVAWYQRKSFWRRVLIYAVVLVVGTVVVRWRWQVKQERQAEQIRTEERRLVKDLVAHYRGVKKVHFYEVRYILMAGGTAYSFRVNDQKDTSAYTVEGDPDKDRGTPVLIKSESFFDTNERERPLSVDRINIDQVEIIYATDLNE